MEEYKIIEGYENYEVSNTGKLRNKSSNKFIVGKNDKDGYIEVSLRHKEGDVNSKRRFFRLHRLVATAFIPNPNNKPLVDHKDGNKANNNVDNLRWASFVENTYNSKKISKDTKTNVKGITLEHGSFKTLDEAIIARYEKAKEIQKEFINECETTKYNIALLKIQKQKELDKLEQLNKNLTNIVSKA
eukprot:gene7752-8377_t